MINVKIALIVAVAAFAAGSLFAPPVQQAIAAVIATDVQCTGCVGTSDVAGNAITAAKIKDGEVKAAEIGTDAVTADEIKGVNKLLFGQCSTSDVVGQKALDGGFIVARCSISGADSDDSVIATLNGGSGNDFCFGVNRAYVESANVVAVYLTDHCETTDPITYGSNNPLSIMVYDK